MSKTLKPLAYCRETLPEPSVSDVERMEAVLARNGYAAPRGDLIAFWQDHHDSIFHSCLHGGDDEDLINVLLRGLSEPDEVLAQ